MVALFSFFVIIILSITVIRIGSTAFVLTGLSEDVASFQAQSAFSGAGFTTSESESVMSNPVRRRIARILILLGNAGISSSMATFILTFISQSQQSIMDRVLYLALGILLIFLLARSDYIEKWMKGVIKKALERHTSLSVYDYQEILGLRQDYTISRINVKPDSWMNGKRLRELDLHKEGVLVLSIQRVKEKEQKFVGVPNGDTEIRSGDTLICYGRGDASKNLSERSKGAEGDDQHRKEVKKEEQIARVREEQGGYS